MDQQVYEIEAVRKRCLDLLRAEARVMTPGEICMQLGLPFWAVMAGLDSARTARLAVFTPGCGWHVQGVQAPHPVIDEEQGDLL